MYSTPPSYMFLLYICNLFVFISSLCNSSPFSVKSLYSIYLPFSCISLFRKYPLSVTARSPYIFLFSPPYSPLIVYINPLHVPTPSMSPFRIYILCVYFLFLFYITSIPCIFLIVYLPPYVFLFCMHTHSMYLFFLYMSSFSSPYGPHFIYSP